MNTPFHISVFYLRPEDFPPDEPDLEPEDLELPCEEALLVAEPELIDLEEEDRT